MATAKRNARKKTTRRNTGRKPAKKNPAKKKAGLTWGKDVKKHPVSGKPCAGRPMSQRDQKLFTKMGKRRAGVTPTMVKEAYGLKPKKAAKKKAAPKRKTAARKPAARKTAAKRSTPKRRKGSNVTVKGCPARCQRYVVVDGSMRFQSSHKLLTTARKKVASLEAKSPRKIFRIVDTKG